MEKLEINHCCEIENLIWVIMERMREVVKDN
jgi:hypothetical protein